MTEANAGRYEEAIEHGLRAVHLSPLDPMNYHPYLGMGFAYLFSGRNEEAVAAANHAIQANPSFMVSHALLVASYAQLGRLDAARVAAQKVSATDGFKRSSQHIFCCPPAATRQAPLQGFSSPASFSALR